MICDRFYNDYFICLTHRYMAPATDALTLYPPLPFIMSATTNRSASTTFTTLSLGRSANAIDLLVPTAPPVHDATDLKARCFDYLADLLLEHASLYSSTELIAAFNHIPGSTYNAAIESASICSEIRSAFFLIDHLVGLGFRDRHGLPITHDITADLSTRPSGLYYFAFRSTVNPTTFDPRILVGSTTIEFCLALPQTTTTATTGRNLFSTPTPAPAHTGPLTAADLPTLDPIEFAKIGAATGSDKLSDYSIDCYSLFSDSQIRHLALRNSTAQTLPVPTFGMQSPRMAAVLASHSSASCGHSYFGSLDVLDFQSVFDSTFPQPVPILLSSSSAVGSSIDSTSVHDTINAFVDQCKFHCFVPIFRTDYVGTSDRNDAASLHATAQALKKLSMSYRNPTSGHWIHLTPNDLFAEYAILTPLLPSNVSLWGFNLVTQFHDSLSTDLQELLLADATYVPPNLASLASRSTQLAALRTLRVAAVRHHTLIRA